MGLATEWGRVSPRRQPRNQQHTESNDRYLLETRWTWSKAGRGEESAIMLCCCAVAKLESFSTADPFVHLLICSPSKAPLEDLEAIAGWNCPRPYQPHRDCKTNSKQVENESVQ